MKNQVLKLKVKVKKTVEEMFGDIQQDVHELNVTTKSMGDTIVDMQKNVQSLADGVDYLKSLNKEMQMEKKKERDQYAEILYHLKKLAGDK